MNLSASYWNPSDIDPPRMTLVAPPAAEPLTLAEAKTWLRVDTSDEDSLITALISAARLHFESITGICIISQQWKVSFSRTPSRYGAYGMASYLVPSLNGFIGSPAGRELIFPRAPLISLDSFQYLDSTATLQTFDPSNFTVGSIGSRNSFGRLWLNDAADWPAIGNFPNAMQIKFTAGMAADQVSVTEDVKIAIRWLVAHYYENRLPVDTGDALAALPFSLQAHIESFRVASLA